MMEPLAWFGWGALYLGIHFLLYGLVFRHTRAFSSERGIFLYHAVSAVIMGVVLLGLWAAAHQSSNTALILGLLSLHGIYSLSFLELWTLSEGSYSLSILNHVKAMGPGGAKVDLTQLRQIGAVKKERRIESLQRLWLVRREGHRFELALLGRLAARGLGAIAWIVNVKNLD